jgi:hypothetical protein
MGTGTFLGEKRPGRGVDHPSPSSAEVQRRVELYLYSCLGLRDLFFSELYLYRWICGLACYSTKDTSYTYLRAVLGLTEAKPRYRKAADEADLANLLVYVRHWYEGDTAEGFWCCDGYEGRTAGKIPVGTSVERNGFLFCRWLTGRRNGGAALTGVNKEFTSRVRSAIPDVMFQRW